MIGGLQPTPWAVYMYVYSTKTDQYLTTLKFDSQQYLLCKSKQE